MKKNINMVIKWALAFCMVAVMLFPATGFAAKKRLAFSGGPDGGTFQYFSNAISIRLSKNIANIEVSNMASAGSVENLRRINSGDADYGIVYSGDLFLGKNGKLVNDTKKYSNVYGMSYLYGSPGHMIVLADSGIKMVKDLDGKRVAVGPAGSGAAASAQRFLTTLGVWDKIKVEYIGYNQGASSLGDKLVDGLWVFAGYPNSSVIQAASSNKIAILNLKQEAAEAGFFNEYPFYSDITIPAGTYSGVDYDVLSFQDSALWVTGKHVSAKDVYNALKEVYSDEGLAYMLTVTKAAKWMKIADGNRGIVTPMHPGAIKFWKEKGLTISPAQSAK
ncbi:TAXI family TRAP transporter solute-binding subunit [bacterium]|nr:TAXI family TRAP transporter solute-binding subunit [bacterium]